MKNQFKITTVQDMINCTNENNVDAFLKDLKGVLLTAHLVRSVTNENPESEGFIWIDDKKNNIEVKISNNN